MTEKICTVCKIPKPLSDFSDLTRSPDGKYPQCRICKGEKDRQYYERETERVKVKARQHYIQNRAKILERRRTDPAVRAYDREYKKKNKERLGVSHKDYLHRKAETVSHRRKAYRAENKEKLRVGYNQWLSSNIHARIARSLRAGVRRTLTSKSFGKPGLHVLKHIGCTSEELKIYIEKQFQPGMTWDNYGKWHIDHIISLASADTAQKVYELCHYRNLQPMWGLDNIRKNKKNGMCWQKLQRDKLIDEDLKTGCPTNTKASEFTLAQESFTPEHRKFIERYEWLGRVGFGVRYTFTARYNGLLGGVVLIGEPNGYQFPKELEALIQRGACASWTPKNLGSRLVMFACNWMAHNTDKRIFTAYSDPDAGEIGTIYQACNFDYLGQTYGVSHRYLFEGQKVNARHFTRTSAIKRWARELNIQWEANWCKANGFQDITAIPPDILKRLREYGRELMRKCPTTRCSPKGKYVLLLKRNRRESIEKTWKSLPYPKRHA